MNDYTVQHLVCYCNTSWNSVLPPPPCPYHTPQPQPVVIKVVIEVKS